MAAAKPVERGETKAGDQIGLGLGISWRRTRSHAIRCGAKELSGGSGLMTATWGAVCCAALHRIRSHAALGARSSGCRGSLWRRGCRPIEKMLQICRGRGKAAARI